MKKKLPLLFMLLALLFSGACSTFCSNLSPQNDCLDVPCVPCIMPLPLNPMNASAGEAPAAREKGALP